MNDLAQIQNASLLIDDETTPEQCAEILAALNAINERVKAATADVKARLVAWCKATGQSITIGPLTYYAGVRKKSPKCVNKPEALGEVLTLSGGDLDKAAEFMSSDPFKYGAIRQAVAPDVYARLFVVEEVDELKEKPAEQLLCADERFSR